MYMYQGNIQPLVIILMKMKQSLEQALLHLLFKIKFA